MSEGFFFENAAAALIFYEECERVHAVTEEERMAVMRRLVAEKKAKYIPHPERLLNQKRRKNENTN